MTGARAHRIAGIALAAITLAASAAIAAATAAPQAPASPVPLRSSDGVSYYNGGAGLDERERIPQEFPLKVMFITDTGKYLCDVTLTATTADGKKSWEFLADDGPWLVIDLPQGAYKLVAATGKVERTASVTIPRKGKRTVLFRWKTTEVDMGIEQ